jgi:hypothetical protein
MRNVAPQFNKHTVVRSLALLVLHLLL